MPDYLHRELEAPAKNCRTCIHRPTCTLVNHPVPITIMGIAVKSMPTSRLMPMPCGGNAWEPEPQHAFRRPTRFFEDLIDQPLAPGVIERVDDDLELNDSGLPV